MKFAMTSLVVTMLLSISAPGVHAGSVIGLTLADTIDASTGGLGTDGKSGAFRFSAIDPATYVGASLFSGDVGSGVIDLTQASPAGSFSTGFQFTDAPFVPYTFGAIDIDITAGVLTVNSLPWGGNYAGLANFNLPPDAGTLVVYNLIQIGVNTYAYRIGWSHLVSGEEYSAIVDYESNAHWVLEGTMTTVPEPETYAMLAAGLGSVGAAARRRRKSARMAA